MWLFWELLFLGFGASIFGTLIGAGGGFILVPVLLMIYPNENPEIITSISLAVVFINALVGSISYAKMKRIDYKSGLIMAGATIPGSILGALTTSYVPRNLFDGLFGIIMIVLAAYLFLDPASTKSSSEDSRKEPVNRHLIDNDGNEYEYSFKPKPAIILSALIGFGSSMLGIGGGIFTVPALVRLLKFPVHIATATSVFTLGIMSLSGSLTHIASGILTGSLTQVAFLAIGVILGAPLGARLSKRLHGKWIINALALAIGLVGIRFLIAAFS